jgi:hypothetical protein
MKIIFVPRTRDFIKENAKVETKVPQLDKMQESWGKKYQVLTLDFKGEFDLTDGDQIYVMGGHGNPGSGVVFWGDEKNEKNWLSAETVAEDTARRFPTLYPPRPVTANIATKPSKEPIPGITIKIYSCHSGEGGYDSFANRFARAFNRAFLCTGDIYEITIFGYTGRISPTPQILSEGNITFSKDIELGRKQFPNTVPENYTGPNESVVQGATHRWSKINPWMYQSRASEARSKVAWLKAVKGTVSQKWGV